MVPADDIDFARDELPGPALHRVLARLRARGPVGRTRWYGRPAWIVTGHRALAAAFRDAERFPPHRPYRLGIEGIVGRTFISMAERDHLVFRKLATPAFRSRAVERYERDGLAALAHELVDRMRGERIVDLMSVFAARFPYLVITRILGLPREQEEAFHAWALALLRFREDRPRAERAARELTALLRPVLAARRRAPRDDVISELAHASVDGRRLSDEEICAHVRLLVPTGGETTHGTLGNALYALLTNRQAWERVCADPSLIPGAVGEVLRWESSIAVLPRMSRSEPIDFFGERVPADAWVLFAIAGANRDPEVFEDPDRFDIDRNTDEALTFGPGPKGCPGMHLARKNLTVAIEVLAARLPGLRLRDPVRAAPRRAVLRCPDALEASWR